VVVALTAASSAAARTVPGRLPDPRRSYAVLIGSASYVSAELDDLPAVTGSLTCLADALTDPQLGVFPPDRCIVIPEPASARTAQRALRKYAALAQDTLLVYWAGHGVSGPRDDLYLTASDTDIDELPVTALAIGHVREAMLSSPAANRILILDACFAGHTVPASGVTAAPAGQVSIEGAYTLVSALPGARCFSPPQAMYTAFTGALIGIMRSGVPGGPELLTLGTIHDQLLHALAGRGLPRPWQSGTAAAGQLALARNPAHRYHLLQRDAYRPASSRPVSYQEPRRMARWRTLLTTVAVVAALGLSIILTNTSQRQAPPAQNAGARSASAVNVNQAPLSFPVSITIGVSPVAILDPTTRSRAINRVIRRLNQQLAVRHLQGLRVGLVEVFAPGPITSIGVSEHAAHLVLDRIRRRDPAFSKAAGQSFWTGYGDSFVFQIYFLT
jgi:Caspase domain